MAFLFFFNFERNYYVLKLKSSCILSNKNINFNKNKTIRKWKISHRVLERRTLCFSSYKNRKLKVKLWWVEARERKKVCLFCTVYFVQKKCFKHLCFISFVFYFRIYTFTYQKTLPHTIFCLFLKSSKPLHVSLK